MNTAPTGLIDALILLTIRRNRSIPNGFGLTEPILFVINGKIKADQQKGNQQDNDNQKCHDTWLD
jgi:hypothetical protein